MTDIRQLSILTYNTHKGFSFGSTRFMLPEMQQAISSLSPDIVFLQETVGQHDKHQKNLHGWPEEPQHQYLANTQWPHSIYGKNALHKNGHHGNAILSKHPFESWENIDVSFQKSASRSVLHGVINLEGNIRLHVLCIHFGLFKAERMEQLQTLSKRIQEHVPNGEPVIIAGDFNDWQHHAHIYLENDLGLFEAYKEMHGSHAKSFPVWQPILKVDRVYYHGLNITNCECLNKKPWSKLSDHAPLHAVFEIKES